MPGLQPKARLQFLSDEYDSETKDIVTRLEKAKTRDQVEASIVEVFEEAFRFSIDEGERELCKQLASEISDQFFTQS